MEIKASCTNCWRESCGHAGEHNPACDRWIKPDRKPFEDYVYNIIGNLGEKDEPFCPFSAGGYCDVKGFDACYHCDFAWKSFEDVN